jgi:dCMP deaminase
VKRADWDSTWIRVAEVMSHRSLCVRARVGAVIVDSSNRIVSTGYNGPPAGFEHHDQPCSKWCTRGQTTVVLAPDYSDCPSLHAEANALSVCDRTTREGGTIYVTSDICLACAKLIANSGLVRVVVVSSDQYAYRNPARSYAMLDTCGIIVTLTEMDPS